MKPIPGWMATRNGKPIITDSGDAIVVYLTERAVLEFCNNSSWCRTSEKPERVEIRERPKPRRTKGKPDPVCPDCRGTGRPTIDSGFEDATCPCAKRPNPWRASGKGRVK